MGRYRKVDTRIWNDAKFASLDDKSKLAFIFILTHPALTSFGCMRATISGLASELGWSKKVMKGAISNLVRDGMLESNEGASFIGLPNFLKYNAPTSPNAISKAWISSIDLLPECPERDRAIKRGLDWLKETASEKFVENLPDQIVSEMRDAMSDAVLKDAIPDAISDLGWSKKVKKGAIPDAISDLGWSKKVKKDAIPELVSDLGWSKKVKKGAISELVSDLGWSKKVKKGAISELVSDLGWSKKVKKGAISELIRDDWLKETASEKLAENLPDQIVSEMRDAMSDAVLKDAIPDAVPDAIPDAVPDAVGLPSPIQEQLTGAVNRSSIKETKRERETQSRLSTPDTQGDPPTLSLSPPLKKKRSSSETEVLELASRCQALNQGDPPTLSLSKPLMKQSRGHLQTEVLELASRCQALNQGDPPTLSLSPPLKKKRSSSETERAINTGILESYAVMPINKGQYRSLKVNKDGSFSRVLFGKPIGTVVLTRGRCVKVNFDFTWKNGKISRG